MCPECDKLVGNDEAGVECDKCLTWYHIQCVGITVNQYKVMVEEGSSRCKFHWYCKPCKPRVIEAVEKIDLLESTTRRIAINVEKLTTRMDTMERKMSSTVVTNVRSELDERSDINRRRLNLMIYNVPTPVIDDQPIGQKNSWYTDKKKKRLIGHTLKK